MYFYKYRNPGNLEFNMLRHGELFFASVSELNDPHECAPNYVFSGSAELWRRFVDLVLSRVCFSKTLYNITSDETRREIIKLAEPMSSQLKSEVGRRDVRPPEVKEILIDKLEDGLREIDCTDIAHHLIRHVESFFKEILPTLLSEATYIASFCESITSQAVWANYADSERGFALVLNTDNRSIDVSSELRVFYGTRPSDQEGLKEIGVYSDSSIPLKEVVYRKEPAKINAFHRLISNFRYTEKEYHYDVPLLIPSEANDKEEDLFGLVKDSGWRYEQEIRALFSPPSTLSPDSRVTRIDRDQISGVVLGPSMSSKDKRRVITCCRSLLDDQFSKSDKPVIPPEDFGLFRATQTEGQYELSVKPFGLISRDFSSGMLIPGSGHLPYVGLDDMDHEHQKRLESIARDLVN